MTDKHASGPLAMTGSPNIVYIVDGENVQIASSSWHSSVRRHYPLQEETVANMQRLAACWNACDGLYTESLERGKPLADQLVDALNQRNTLLDDLKAAAITLRTYEALHRAKETAESTAKADVNAALAARFEATIAKATGGKA